MTTPPALDQVTQTLAQHQNLTRIKKLLIYACGNAWETDRQRLDQYHLPDLLQSLLISAPTLEQLKLHLARVVKTLSKPAEYALVANAIVNLMKQLYSAELDLTDQVPLVSTPEQQLVAEHLRTIAKTFQQDPDTVRLKKILWCACTQIWENDPQRLEALNLVTLVQDLYELAPTRTSLKAVLISIIQSLNRQAHYKQVAQKVLTAFEPLFFVPAETQLLPGLPASVVAETLAHLPTAAIALEPTAFEPIAFEPIASEPIASELVAYPSIISAISQLVSPDPGALFDLRLEIIKYANPLRVKILIFSMIHGFLDGQDESWAGLKAHELDDLLQALFRECKTLATLEFRLSQTVKSFKQPNEYRQAADAIARAMKSFYIHSDNEREGDRVSETPQWLQPLVVATEQDDQTNLNPMRSEDDNTCEMSF
jgi:hypothetical protein